MKIITEKMLPKDVKQGDRFLNTTITARSEVFYLPDKSNPTKKRPYLEAQCDCGNMIKGKTYPYARWDRVHTKDPNKAPHTMRCSKCSAGGKSRGMETTWLNTAKSEKEISMDNFNNLSGQFFGDLFVRKCTGTDQRSHRLYECICSCGTIETIADDRLKRNKIACSKCLSHLSAGEKIIKSYLEKKNKKFIMQYSFPDLIGNNNKLRFDFCIFDDKNNIKALIEFQGKQHYMPIDFFGGKKQFLLQQKYDNKKRNYCKKHGYILIEIPYNYDNIDKYLTSI